MAEAEQKLKEMSISDSSTAWPAAKVRSTFIDFFVKKKGHTFWPSSPVVPVNDPTLLFANAGMNQYKPLFLGTCDPTLELSRLKMAVNSQKCIRAGGKHNDLDDVGKDVYHHTFFEMLGNWSFGQYFKDEAIAWGWECLTKEYNLDTSRIYATYFGGDEAQGLPPDLEAKQFWLRFLPEERILPFGCKDNFWEMGATGPCGPCSELHYDRIGGRDASKLVNADLPDVIEIWNIVFIQYNREADGSLKPLPATHVDTGMGFERLSSILQGKNSNYDTDIFTPLFAAIQSITGCRPYQGKVGADVDEGLVDMAYRVVADHVRTLTFAITDGAVPSNDGRGYVLRRILRRAVRYGQEMLNAPQGFFTQLVPYVVTNFSDFFPELVEKQSFVMSVVADEEQSFNRTLDLGVKHFNKVVTALQSTTPPGSVISAKDTHILFSSMGFPVDLTQLMAEERGLTVDVAGFDALMKQDRKISEAAELSRKGGGGKDLSLEAEQTAWLQNNNIPTTESDLKYTWHCAPTAKVLAVFTGRGQQGTGFEASAASASDGTVGVILDKTSFYYESGGQIFDTGALVVTADGSGGSGAAVTFEVSNSQSYAGYVVHVGAVTTTTGSIKVGDTVEVKVDYDRRSFVAPNHTMTHVLNYALRAVLLGDNGDNKNNDKKSTAPVAASVDQKGSLVDAQRLRFDFSWSEALSAAQVARIENLVNQQIQSKLPVYAEVVPLADASKIQSLRQVFGERYPDPVRVISVGQPVGSLVSDPDNTAWSNYSVEFCGGTHLNNTSEAESFAIIEESGIAKGIRRITAFTRAAAAQARDTAVALEAKIDALAAMPGGPELSATYKNIKSEVDAAVVSLVDKETMRGKLSKIYETIRAFHKASLATRIADASALAEQRARTAKEQGKGVVLLQLEIGADGKIAKKLHEKLKKVYIEGSYFVASLDDDMERCGIYPLVSATHLANPDLKAKGFTAKAWVEFCISKVGAGKGGGKADTANASVPGGQDVMDKILAAAEEFAVQCGLTL